MPRLAVVPMGFSWALWICQQIHQRAALRCGLSKSQRLRDRQPWRGGEQLHHSEYVDNFIALSKHKSVTMAAVSNVVDDLLSLGLPVHDIKHSCTRATLLGWEVDGRLGTVRPTQRRLWKVRLAIRQILKNGSASGADIESHFY